MLHRFEIHSAVPSKGCSLAISRLNFVVNDYLHYFTNIYSDYPKNSCDYCDSWDYATYGLVSFLLTGNWLICRLRAQCMISNHDRKHVPCDGVFVENVTWKVNLRCLKLYRAYSISFNSSNVGKFFWSWILNDCIKVQENKKKVVVFWSCPRQNVKLGSFTL